MGLQVLRQLEWEEGIPSEKRNTAQIPSWTRGTEGPLHQNTSDCAVGAVDNSHGYIHPSHVLPAGQTHCWEIHPAGTVPCKHLQPGELDPIRTNLLGLSSAMLGLS